MSLNTHIRVGVRCNSGDGKVRTFLPVGKLARRAMKTLLRSVNHTNSVRKATRTK
jgi:hypothetical protein